MTNLPPGPYQYRSKGGDVPGMIRDSDGELCAYTCPFGLSGVFPEHSNGETRRQPSLEQARAIAELLIRAEREHDPTPLTIDHVEQMLGKKVGDDLHFIVEGGSIIEFEWYEWEVLAWLDDGGREPMRMMTLKTHGQFRTFCRLFGIEEKP